MYQVRILCQSSISNVTFERLFSFMNWCNVKGFCIKLASQMSILNASSLHKLVKLRFIVHENDFANSCSIVLYVLFISLRSYFWLSVDFRKLISSCRNWILHQRNNAFIRHSIWCVLIRPRLGIGQWSIVVRCNQSCFVSKETTDVTVTRGTLCSNKV